MLHLLNIKCILISKEEEMLSFGNIFIEWSTLSQTEKLVFLILLWITVLILISFYFYDNYKNKKS